MVYEVGSIYENYPVFTVSMVIYRYVEIICITLDTPNFLYNIYNNHEKTIQAKNLIYMYNH